MGALPDADSYGDYGSNTLGHVIFKREKIALDNLISLGLGKLVTIRGSKEPQKLLGAYGKLAERSPGKDTITGHWELAGLILDKPFPLYPEGFPAEIINSFEAKIRRKTLGNVAASGTEIIKRLGAEHLRTGFPLVYTSADSVFQLAAHEDLVPVDTLYDWCLKARKEVLVGKHAVGRVIARPFKGQPGNFYRTKNRKDFSLPPPDQTLLDLAKEKNYDVWVVGKVLDIFSGRGITRHIPASNNRSIMQSIFAALEQQFTGILWANLVDFDMLYGHRNDAEGFAAALEEFDIFLGALMKVIKGDDLLIITADHGCDPTFKGTDHTREYVPVLIYGAKIIPGSLGIRKSFADLGATVAEALSCGATKHGRSFAGQLFGKRGD